MSVAVKHLPSLAKLTSRMVERRLNHPRYTRNREQIEDCLADLLVSDDLALPRGLDSIGHLWWEITKVPQMNKFITLCGIELYLMVAIRKGDWEAFVDRFAKAFSNDGGEHTVVTDNTTEELPEYNSIAPTLRNSSWLLVLLVLANSPYEDQFLGV